MIRKENRSLFYVDAGNALVPKERKLPTSYYYEKAETLIGMLNAMGLDVFAPGPHDFELGSEKLKALSKQAKFPFVASNVKDKGGNALFERYVILERKGLKVAFISLTPVEKMSDPSVRVDDPKDTAIALAKEIGSDADIIVALSQMESARDEKLVNELPVQIIVGADPAIAVHRAFWGKDGRALLVDTSDQGQMLGRLDADLKIPFQGFYSNEDIKQNLARLDYFEKKSVLNPKDEALKSSISNFKKTAQLSPIPGGSFYEHGLIELTEKRFGKKNQLSKAIADEAKRLRKKALGE